MQSFSLSFAIVESFQIMSVSLLSFSFLLWMTSEDLLATSRTPTRKHREARMNAILENHHPSLLHYSVVSIFVLDIEEIESA